MPFPPKTQDRQFKALAAVAAVTSPLCLFPSLPHINLQPILLLLLYLENQKTGIVDILDEESLRMFPYEWDLDDDPRAENILGVF